MFWVCIWTIQLPPFLSCKDTSSKLVFCFQASNSNSLSISPLCYSFSFSFFSSSPLFPPFLTFQQRGWQTSSFPFSQRLTTGHLVMGLQGEGWWHPGRSTGQQQPFEDASCSSYCWEIEGDRTTCWDFLPPEAGFGRVSWAGVLWCWPASWLHWAGGKGGEQS